MHRRPESLRLREPCVSRGIHSRSREAFEALLTRRQPGHRRRSDAEELRAAEATSRGMAGAAVVNGFGKAADLPGVHRGRNWGFRSTWRGGCTICTFSPCMRSSRREPCGACRTPSPARSRNWSQFRSTRRRRSWRAFCKRSGLRNPQQQRRCAVPPDAPLPSLGLRGRRWNRTSDKNRQTPVNGTQEKFHETPSE